MMRPFSRRLHVWAALILLLPASFTWAGALQQVTVFQQGESGYNTFRIPAIVQANDGTLLAFAEGRVNSAGDSGNIDLVLKRSFDGGATWGPLQLIQSNGTTEAGNPAPVVDLNTGNIIIFFVTDRQNPAYRMSTNNGATWSAKVDLTATAKLSTWNGYAAGPVHGIQLLRGPHAGRLIVSGNHTLLNHNLNPDGRESHMIYSDDGGVTWQVGGVLKNSSGDINPNESTIVELVDGTVYMNTRNQGGLDKRRLKGYSTDSGLSFVGPAQVEYQLVDPVVQGSLLRYAAIDQGDAVNRILFANPATETSRVRMTIKSTFDETVTWNSGKLVYRGPSGYSDMVKTAFGGGILYENGTSAYYNKISFARFDTAWLDSPALMRIDFRDYNAKDQEGNGLTGSFDASQSYIAGDPRYSSGIALHCDGNDVVRYADSANHLFDFDATDSFTLETVFRTSSHIDYGPNGAGGLIAKDASSGPYYWLRVESGKLRFGASDGTTTNGVIGTETVSDGDWHHAALVFDRTTSQIRLYVDYQLDNSAAITLTGSLANSSDLLVGAFNTGTFPLNLIGDLDLARISMGALTRSQFVQPTLTAGDANGDGMVNLADLQILGDNWQSGDACWVLGDFTGDGEVTLADLQVLGDHWGYGVSSDITFDQALQLVGLNIPEPALWMLMSLGAIAVMRRVRGAN